jgi:hypothetical protein
MFSPRSDGKAPSDGLEKMEVPFVRVSSLLSGGPGWHPGRHLVQ